MGRERPTRHHRCQARSLRRLLPIQVSINFELIGESSYFSFEARSLDGLGLRLRLWLWLWLRLRLRLRLWLRLRLLLLLGLGLRFRLIGSILNGSGRPYGQYGHSLCLPVVVTILPRTFRWVLAENHCQACNREWLEWLK